MKLNIKFLFILMLLSSQASAGEIYRCLDSEGSASYTQKAIANMDCVVVRKNVVPEPPKPVVFDTDSIQVGPQPTSQVNLKIKPPAAPPKGLPPLPPAAPPKPNN